jgi:sulfoxide reductase catalytic subunit YedY
MLIKVPRGWELPESKVTPETVYRNRRQLLRDLGLGALALSGLAAGCDRSGAQPQVEPPKVGGGPTPPDAGGLAEALDWSEAHKGLYPVKRNELYKVAERGISPESKAIRYNNFYEFTTDKERVWGKVGGFQVRPWTVEVKGLVRKPQVLDLDALVRTMPLEERVYRFRCVEAWSMTVPWTGFPMSALIEKVEPSAEAKYVRFVTASRPAEMPGVEEAPYYPWPYFEGLRLEEAMNPLAMFVTGIYGKPLPRQNGAPLRVVTPWKYGYKSIKSVVEIEFVAQEPETFWHKLQAEEYPFLSNVDPEVPHPRWSQATERLLDTGDRIPTMKYNGYEAEVAALYKQG